MFLDSNVLQKIATFYKSRLVCKRRRSLFWNAWRQIRRRLFVRLEILWPYVPISRRLNTCKPHHTCCSSTKQVPWASPPSAPRSPGCPRLSAGALLSLWTDCDLKIKSISNKQGHDLLIEVMKRNHKEILFIKLFNTFWVHEHHRTATCVEYAIIHLPERENLRAPICDNLLQFRFNVALFHSADAHVLENAYYTWKQFHMINQHMFTRAVRDNISGI